MKSKYIYLSLMIKLIFFLFINSPNHTLDMKFLDNSLDVQPNEEIEYGM